MSISVPVSYANATLSSSTDLEKTQSNSQVALRPRDEDDENIVGLCHFNDINADTTGYIARMFTESAYDSRLYTYSALWDSTVKKFGAASIKLDSTSDFARLPYNARWNNLSEFTVDINAYFTSVGGTGYFLNEYYIVSSSQRGRWLVGRNGTELVMMTFNSSGVIEQKLSTGAGLQINTWYHIRFAYQDAGAGTSNAKVFLNGTAVITSTTAKQLETLAENICPQITVGALISTNGTYGNGALGYYDELVIYPAYLSSNFTPRTSALAPFKTTGAAVSVTLDSGSAGSTWDMSTLAFNNEDAFDSENIKIKYEISDSAQSTYSAAMTLTEFKAETDGEGQYLYLQFPYTSDGDTKYTLHSGSISVTPASASAPNAATFHSIENDSNGSSVTLTITPPASGNYLRTNIYYRQYGRPSWSTGTAYTGTQGVKGTHTISGLTDNVLYQFYIAANYSGLNSAPSDVKTVWCTSSTTTLEVSNIVDLIEDELSVLGLKMGSTDFDAAGGDTLEKYFWLNNPSGLPVKEYAQQYVDAENFTVTIAQKIGRNINEAIKSIGDRRNAIRQTMTAHAFQNKLPTEIYQIKYTDHAIDREDKFMKDIITFEIQLRRSLI